MTELAKEQLVDHVEQRVLNYYKVRGLCCSEAIVLVLVKGFGVEMADELAVGIASGLCGGMGGGECVCGALSGAEVALGIHLGPSRRGGLSKSKMRQAAKLLHDKFRHQYASTCCQDLTKGIGSRKAKAESCGKITGWAARTAAEILLDLKPELLKKADIPFLQDHDSKISLLVKKVVG